LQISFRQHLQTGLQISITFRQQIPDQARTEVAIHLLATTGQKSC